MATVIIMPRQGQSVESCIITEIRKKKGDSVARGEILFAYETDKASFEEESPVDGVILELFFNEGDEVPVLTNVMVVGKPGESFDEYRPDGTISTQMVNPDLAEVKVEPASLQDGSLAKPQSNEAKTEDGAGISPRARQQAAKKGVDVQSIAGTGPKGRIIERDITSAAANAPKMTPLAKSVANAHGLMAPDAGSGLAGTVKTGDLVISDASYGGDFELKPLTNIRKLIAKAMHASLQNSAQLTHHLGADARRITELRKKVKTALDQGSQINITLNDMVCFAVIKALKKFPQVNSHFMGDTMKLFKKVHLGLAVDTDRGLMVPAIRNADDLSIQGLASQFKEIANSCRKGSINPELLSSEAASFTVSNLGNYGVEMFTPVINLPQSAILGVNTIIPRPKDLGDGVYGFVPHIGLSLTYNHQALDGGEATRFLKQVAIEIENLEFDI